MSADDPVQRGCFSGTIFKDPDKAAELDGPPRDPAREARLGLTIDDTRYMVTAAAQVREGLVSSISAPSV